MNNNCVCGNMNRYFMLCELHFFPFNLRVARYVWHLTCIKVGNESCSLFLVSSWERFRAPIRVTNDFRCTFEPHSLSFFTSLCYVCPSPFCCHYFVIRRATIRMASNFSTFERSQRMKTVSQG